jgi:hypothetical protein
MTVERTEQRLAELAIYHVGLFVGIVSREVDPAMIAHALFLLAREAERRRDERIAVPANEDIKYCPICRCKTWHTGGVCERADGHDKTVAKEDAPAKPLPEAR